MGIHLRVLYYGQDVTTRCRYADDVTNHAVLYALDRDGRKYLDPETGGAAVETVWNGIEIIRVDRGDE
jgi:hypothetical protein